MPMKNGSFMHKILKSKLFKDNVSDSTLVRVFHKCCPYIDIACYITALMLL